MVRWPNQLQMRLAMVRQAKRRKDRGMTRQEAIYRLNNTAWLGSDEDREATEEAVKLAIKALEREPSRAEGEWTGMCNFWSINERTEE